MNAMTQIFMNRRGLGLSPKSLPLIHFQLLGNSLFIQTIKRAVAFLIHQMAVY